MRVNPGIDGFINTTIFEDSVPLDPKKHGVDEPWGVRYVTETSVIEKDGHEETSIDLARSFKIRNDKFINKVSDKPVAYEIQTLASQKMLMGADSFNQKRAGFAAHPVWINKFAEDELYAAGEYTWQSQESDGVERWAARGESVRDSDLVFWHNFSLTHNPRSKDLPVMPIERISVHIKPSGLFEKTLALDGPASNQAFN